MDSKQAPTNSGLKDDLADGRTLVVVKRLHGLVVASLMPPDYEGDHVGLVRDPVGLEVKVEGFQRKIFAFLKKNQIGIIKLQLTVS